MATGHSLGPDVAAVILAGGFGTRIRHLLADLPKPMAPVAGRPFVEWVARFLARQGVTRMVICAGFLVAGLLHGEPGSLHRFLERPVPQFLGQVDTRWQKCKGPRRFSTIVGQQPECISLIYTRILSQQDALTFLRQQVVKIPLNWTLGTTINNSSQLKW